MVRGVQTTHVARRATTPRTSPPAVEPAVLALLALGRSQLKGRINREELKGFSMMRVRASTTVSKMPGILGTQTKIEQ